MRKSAPGPQRSTQGDPEVFRERLGESRSCSRVVPREPRRLRRAPGEAQNSARERGKAPQKTHKRRPKAPRSQKKTENLRQNACGNKNTRFCENVRFTKEKQWFSEVRRVRDRPKVAPESAKARQRSPNCAEKVEVLTRRDAQNLQMACLEGFGTRKRPRNDPKTTQRCPRRPPRAVPGTTRGNVGG